MGNGAPYMGDEEMKKKEKEKGSDRILYERDNIMIKGYSDGYFKITLDTWKVGCELKIRLTREDALEIFNWLGYYYNEFQLNDGSWLNDHTHPEVKK